MKKILSITVIIILGIAILYRKYNKPLTTVIPVNAEYFEMKYKNKTPIMWGEKINGVITRINTNELVLALTLDACGSKNDGVDMALMDFLIAEKIPATLFINSRWIDNHPEEFMKLAKNELFDIQNHGTQHTPASINGKSVYKIRGTRSPGKFFHEINDNADKIKALTGTRPIFFRSGTAFYDEYAVEIIRETGALPIGYSILGDAGATYTTQQVFDAVLKAKNGDIIIAHMNHPEKQTGSGLKKSLPVLKQKGFRFVKLKDYIANLE